MKALVSGQAATAVLFDGEAVHRLHLDEPDSLIPCRRGDVPRLFADCDDLVQIDGASREAVVEELERLWARDRAMHMALILLDRGVRTETRRMAAEGLDELIESQAVADFAAYRLYAKPLPDRADAEGAVRCAKAVGAKRAAQFIDALAEHQGYVQDRRAAWDAIPDDLFESPDIRNQFEEILVSQGFFYQMAVAAEEPSALDSVIVLALGDLSLRRLPRYRDVLMTWKDGCMLVRPREKRDVGPERHEPAQPEVPLTSSAQPDRSAYERVERQKDAIEQALRQGNCHQARRWTEDLIEFQKRNSTDQQIAMSLCDLARRAKTLSLPDEQFAFADRAVGFAFHDPQTHTQRADACKSQGKLAEALDAYDDARQRFPQDVVVLGGRAEVLKDLGKLEDALGAYDEAREKFPHDAVACNGRAEVLKELGKLDEALDAYDQACGDFPHDPYSHAGRAEVLKELGRLNEALAAYDEARGKFPHDVVTCTGRAEVLREQGKLGDALGAYDEAREKFPQNVVACSGRAEVLKEQGKLEEALAAYDEAREEFPHDAVTRNGRASTLVLLGRFAEARASLPTVEPHTREDWIARHVSGMISLKEGALDQAAAAFRQGLDCPFADCRAYFRTALAMTELRQQQYEEAARLVEEDVRPGPLLSVIRMHAFGELNATAKAADAYQHIRDNPNPNLVELREELAARYVAPQPDHVRRPDEWVYEQEWRLAMCA